MVHNKLKVTSESNGKAVDSKSRVWKSMWEERKEEKPENICYTSNTSTIMVSQVNVVCVVIEKFKFK